MGALYTVSLKTKFKPCKEAEAFRELRSLIGADGRIDYGIAGHERDGLYADSVDHCIKYFLADWPTTRVRTEEESGWKTYSNEFKATYGWGSVMDRMFFSLVPYLGDGSFLEVSVDNDHWRMEIKDGLIAHTCA